MVLLLSYMVKLDELTPTTTPSTQWLAAIPHLLMLHEDHLFTVHMSRHQEETSLETRTMMITEGEKRSLQKPKQWDRVGRKEGLPISNYELTLSYGISSSQLFISFLNAHCYKELMLL